MAGQSIATLSHQTGVTAGCDEKMPSWWIYDYIRPQARGVAKSKTPAPVTDFGYVDMVKPEWNDMQGVSMSMPSICTIRALDKVVPHGLQYVTPLWSIRLDVSCLLLVLGKL